MRVERRADGSLLVRETFPVLRVATLLGAVLLAALVVPPCLGAAVCNTRELSGGLITAGVLALAGALVQDTVFEFDRSARVVRWRRRRLFAASEGAIAFADITDVAYRASIGIDTGDRRPTYRLALATRTGDVFLSATHSIAKEDYAALAETVRTVIQREHP